MGLDMYLYKKVKNAKKQEVAYWRKANQIRGWFVRHGLIEAQLFKQGALSR